MNFLSLVLVVISTAGIQNIYADDWTKEREHLGTHFLKLITAFQNEAEKRTTEVLKHNMNIEDPAGSYGKINIYTPVFGYVENGRDFELFKSYTEKKIEYFKKTALTKFAKINGAPEFRRAIEELGKDINEDTELPDKYKYKKLPFRDLLKEMYTRDFKGTKEEFLKAFPELKTAKNT